MNERSVVTPRLLMGLVILTLGILWTLDTMDLIDASLYVRWWPLVALGWGVMCLTGAGCPRNTGIGLFWTIIGGAYLLNTLNLVHFSLFELWPLFLIAVGASIVFRGWRGQSWTSGATETGSTLNTLALLAGAERKVVAQDFRRGEVSAVMGGAVVDFRPARLAEGRAVVDVFAMWGGIELIVPEGWRVVGEVTPILGGFEDSTVPPVDPSAPTLVVKGTVMMGGVQVMNENRRRADGVRTYGGIGVVGRVRSDGDSERKDVVVGPGVITVRSRGKEIRVSHEGVTVRRGLGPDEKPGVAPEPATAPPESRPVEPE